MRAPRLSASLLEWASEALAGQGVSEVELRGELDALPRLGDRPRGPLGDDARRRAADLEPPGLHRGQPARKALQKLDAVEARKADLAGHVDALLEAVEQPSCPDQVVG